MNNASLSTLLRATNAAIYGLIGVADRAHEEAIIAVESAKMHRLYFLAPLALAHLKNGHLFEAGEALQPMYEDSRMESKRNMEYLGTVSALPNLIRIELALATQDYVRVLTFASDTHARAEKGGERIFLSDVLRIKGQALFALGRVREAWTALTDARDLAGAQQSRRALWPILFEMSQVASLEGNHDESERLLEESRETVNYIADHCGSSEIRDSFLDVSLVRKVLGTTGSG